MACRAAFPGEPTELLLGKAMFEVKRPGISKGESIRKLMAHPPFAGRMPVFIGDDVTDESVFEVLAGDRRQRLQRQPSLPGSHRNIQKSGTRA